MAAGSDTHAVGARPHDFVSYWAWGVAQTTTLNQSVPLSIHARSGDRSGWGNIMSQAVIRGLPFSDNFVTYVLRRNPCVSGAFTRGMAPLHSYQRRQSDEFRILYALLGGETDPEIVRIVLLGSPRREYFEETAVRALEFVYERVKGELALVKDPPERAGAA